MLYCIISHKLKRLEYLLKLCYYRLMSERSDGEPQLPTILPDGQEIFFDNKYQRLLAERLVLTNSESPIDFMDLGIEWREF